VRLCARVTSSVAAAKRRKAIRSSATVSSSSCLFRVMLRGGTFRVTNYSVNELSTIALDPVSSAGTHLESKFDVIAPPRAPEPQQRRASGITHIQRKEHRNVT